MVGRKRLWVIIPLMVVVSAPFSFAQLGRLLKGGAVLFLVRQFSKDIDKAINTALQNKDWQHRQATKVVPIVSVGQGAYVGAAQVIGEKKDVQRVEAVAQLEIDLPGKARAKILVPVDKVSLDISKLRRVPKVGISAVIDLKL